MRARVPIVPLLAALTAAALASAAVPSHVHADGELRAADRVYIVAPSDTLSRVAQHLHVTPAVLAARNYLRPPYRLRLGQRLRIPDGVPPEVLRTLPLAHRDAPTTAARGHASPATPRAPAQTDATSHRPGFVTLIRHRDGAELTTNFGVVNQAFRTRIERFMRFRDGSRHNVHPRLVRELAAISDHFDGRPITLLSGFRPQLRHSDSGRTRHSQGFAADIRIDGVSLDALEAFCESRENLGCGLYPRARFVHVDVRREPARWVDNAAPNTRRAETHPSESDETVDEVMADAAPVRDRGDSARE